MTKIPDSHDLVSFANDLCGRRFSPGIDNVNAQNNLNDTLLKIVFRKRTSASFYRRAFEIDRFEN